MTDTIKRADSNGFSQSTLDRAQLWSTQTPQAFSYSLILKAYRALYKTCLLYTSIMCFTHYHADHISGLPGMLLNMTNSDRTEPVIMIGPKGLFNIVKSLRCIAPELSFEMRFIELDQNTEEYKLGPYVIKAFKVKHAIPCYGYRCV